MPTSTVDLPRGRGPHPAIVGLHPADDASRDHYLFRHLAKVLPRRGIAVARFDRRGDDVPFEDQIADTLDVLTELRRRPEIDAARIGLWGFSQGAWIAPMVASRTDVAFLVLVASVGVTPAAQMLYGTAKHVREAGFGDGAADRVIAARRRVDEYRRGRGSVSDAQRAIDAIKDEPFFAHAYLPADAGALGPWPDMDFDPAPVFAQVKVPVLLFYGEDDEWQPIDASIRAWRDSGNSDLTIVRLPGAAHAPTIGGVKDIAKVSPDYERALVSWLLRVTAG
ncbi:MAG TPA: alpha/beta hydrolase [Candidatus Acidoferrales bacterium]|nr:alpha/beta hydrolase [Candidatus Acidoferrales bacterium]